MTFPTKVVEHISDVLESLENGHVENVPHVRFRLFSETSLMCSDAMILALAEG